MRTSTVGLILGLVFSGTFLQAETTNTISIREPWSNVFGGKESLFHVSVLGTSTFDGRLGWQLAAEGRTLARGEAAIAVRATVPGEAEIRVPIPEVKPGVIMQTRLSLVVMNAEKEVVKHEKTLWIFPEDALANRGEWLKTLGLKLFDPVGKTSKLFDGLGIPYSTIRAIDSLSEVKDGLVLIGEGVSFKEYRGLAASMIKTAASGVSVICLAPAEGEINLPASGTGDLPPPLTMEFKREGVIQTLDKRLDSNGWAPDGRSVACGMALKGERGPVLVEVGNDSSEWLWIELGYAKNNAKCVICGFGIVGKWADSPTPRFLLMKILETVSVNKVSK